MKTVLEHYRGNEQLVARILDFADQSEHQNRCIITPFLTPQEQLMAQKVIGKQQSLAFDGGYDAAEMKRMAICPYECDVDFGIVCLKSEYRIQDRKLSHRDVLGALLHLGIERDQFGDLLVDEHTIHLFVRSELSEFLRSELHKIHRSKIVLEPYVGEVLFAPTLEWHHHTVSSARLDCIVAACIRGSRSKAEALIRGKFVKLNHLPLEDCKNLCNNDCTVSIRGYGRFLVKFSERVSKKGRIVIEVGKYQ